MRRLLIPAAVVTPVVAWLVSSDLDSGLRLAALLLVVAPLGLWIAIRAPQLVYRLFAVVLGAIPFASVPGLSLPGFSIPLVLLLAVAVVATSLIQLAQQRRPIRISATEICSALLIVASAVSVIVTVSTSYDLTEFTKWLIATSVVFSLVRLDREALAAVGRSFVWGVAAAALFALFLLFFDRTGSRLSLLSFLGYGATGTDNLRYVIDASGATVRLTGTYVDPNVAGLFLFVGMMLGLARFTGARRVALTAVIGASLALTLSRSALLATVVALLVLILIHRLGFGRKVGVVVVALIGIASVLLIPAVQSRLSDSFGQYDTGSANRVDALRAFPQLLSGHWLFGLGWGRIEFRDATAGFAANVVANAPLLSVYRGGILVGLAFVLVLVVALVAAVRALRSSAFDLAVVGACGVGFILVAMQLDFPVVTISPVTALFSLLLATLVGRSRTEPADRLTANTRAAALATPGNTR